MNRNHMLKRKMTAGLAVGMAVAVGSVPMAMAANTANTKDSSSSVSKEETVYVNADASGNPQQITVSNWLKNAGSESNVEDQSDLTNIKNVKGDETFSENGDSLTWNTDGSDIYYQGQSNKDLPVSVKFTYLLDGQEMQPQDLVGKSGHLQIKIQYTNNEKKSDITNNGSLLAETEVKTKVEIMIGSTHLLTVSSCFSVVLSGASPHLGFQLASTTLKQTEVVDTITHTDDPVFTECLIELHTRHTEIQHTRLAILTLESHVIIKCNIHTQQRRESLIDAHLRNVKHTARRRIPRRSITDEAQTVHILLIGAVTVITAYCKDALIRMVDVNTLEVITEPRQLAQTAITNRPVRQQSAQSRKQRERIATHRSTPAMLHL